MPTYALGIGLVSKKFKPAVLRLQYLRIVAGKDAPADLLYSAAHHASPLKIGEDLRIEADLSEFFEPTGVNIYDDAYAEGSGSSGK